ncbi:hypothetical protein MMC06_001254 [Schaereria dolodes]|nr:hypothetical protein [Schaereria dolodes]
MAGISLAIGRKFSLSQFWNDVRESEATFFVYVGETARYLLAAPPSPLDKEHKIRCMHGNGLRPDVWAKFQERFGIPEVAEFFTATEGMFSLVSWCRGPYLVNTVGHHGLIMRRLFHNTYVPFKIDSATNNFYRSPTTRLAERVPYEEGGEIMVKVPNEDLFSGYYGAPEATSKKFARDVLRKGDLYYRPGDALRRTSDGRWFFMDRLGDTYRWKSENVSTAEVAEVLGTYPGIHEANVYGVLLPGHDGRAGCTAVSIDPLARKEFDWKAFTKFARRNLPDYAVPIFVRVVQGEIGGMGSHNNKQNKVPLREEGVDPKMKGRRVEGGEEDEMFWIPPQGDAYVKFEGKDWDGIVAGQARL